MASIDTAVSPAFDIPPSADDDKGEEKKTIKESVEDQKEEDDKTTQEKVTKVPVLDEGSEVKKVVILEGTKEDSPVEDVKEIVAESDKTITTAPPVADAINDESKIVEKLTEPPQGEDSKETGAKVEDVGKIEEKKLPEPAQVEDGKDAEPVVEDVGNIEEKPTEPAQGTDVKETEPEIEDVKDAEPVVIGVGKIEEKPTEPAQVEDAKDAETLVVDVGKIEEKPIEPLQVEDAKDDEPEVEDVGKIEEKPTEPLEVEDVVKTEEKPTEPAQSTDVKDAKPEVEDVDRIEEKLSEAAQGTDVKEPAPEVEEKVVNTPVEDVKDTEAKSKEKIVEVEDVKETETGVEEKIVDGPVGDVKDTESKSEGKIADLPLDDVNRIEPYIISEAKIEGKADGLPVTEDVKSIEATVVPESETKIEETISELPTAPPEPEAKLEETISEQPQVEELNPKPTTPEELETKTGDAVLHLVETEPKPAEESIVSNDQAIVETETQVSEVAKSLVQSVEVPEKHVVEESNEKEVRTLEAKLQQEKLALDTPDETVQDRQTEEPEKKDDPIPEPTEVTETRDANLEKGNAKEKTPKQSFVKIFKSSLSKAKKAILGKSQNVKAKDAGADQ